MKGKANVKLAALCLSPAPRALSVLKSSLLFLAHTSVWCNALVSSLMISGDPHNITQNLVFGTATIVVLFGHPL